MIKSQFTYPKSKLSKWMLIVTLFFTSFSFSGHVDNSLSGQYNATQTELLLSNNCKTSKQTILYKGVLAPKYADKHLNNRLHRINRLLACHKLTKIKLDLLSRQLYLIKTPNQFLQLKTIPQSSNEDIPSFVTG